jgi:hypothetical protein
MSRAYSQRTLARLDAARILAAGTLSANEIHERLGGNRGAIMAAVQAVRAGWEPTRGGNRRREVPLCCAQAMAHLRDCPKLT